MEVGNVIFVFWRFFIFFVDLMFILFFVLLDSVGKWLWREDGLVYFRVSRRVEFFTVDVWGGWRRRFGIWALDLFVVDCVCWLCSVIRGLVWGSVRRLGSSYVWESFARGIRVFFRCGDCRVFGVFVLGRGR